MLCEAAEAGEAAHFICLLETIRVQSKLYVLLFGLGVLCGGCSAYSPHYIRSPVETNNKSYFNWRIIRLLKAYTIYPLISAHKCMLPSRNFASYLRADICVCVCVCPFSAPHRVRGIFSSSFAQSMCSWVTYAMELISVERLFPGIHFASDSFFTLKLRHRMPLATGSSQLSINSYESNGAELAVSVAALL